MRGVAPGIKPLHHYSTTEQVVGTWIDGKPVYEKTIEFTGGFNIPIGYVYDNIPVQGLPLNVERIIDSFVVSYDAGSSIAPFVCGGLVLKYVNFNASYIGIFNTSIAASADIPQNGNYVTIRYTKTTDTAPSA